MIALCLSLNFWLKMVEIYREGVTAKNVIIYIQARFLDGEVFSSYVNHNSSCGASSTIGYLKGTMPD
jgi:hypothetical protein